MKRRAWLGAVSAATLLMGGCSIGTPPTRWYELRTDLPAGTAAPAAVPGDGAVWEVASDMHLSGALDRDTLVLADGRASLLPLAGHRWSEPLRDSIPRLLVYDLRSLRGPALVWAAPAPAEVSVARRLRVEMSKLEAGSDRRALRLQARWWLVDSRPRPSPSPSPSASQALPATGPTDAGSDAPPTRVGSADFEVALNSDSVDALAAAHRLALWLLAVLIAGTP